MNQKDINAYFLLVLSLLILSGCSSGINTHTLTSTVGATPTMLSYPQATQKSIATAPPIPTVAIHLATADIIATPNPIETATFVLSKRDYLVTSELGNGNQNFSMVKYYDENNIPSNEFMIQRRIIEVSTTEDGRFLAYYGEGKWVGDSFKNYDGFYILDTVTRQETELQYQNCTGPAAWDSTTYRLAVSCGDLIVIAFVDNQWVEEGKISLPDQYNSMPVELRPQLVAPSWSPDGKSIAYIQDNSANKPGAASGPFISDTACITDKSICITKTRNLGEPVSATSVLSWSADASRLYIANTEGEKILEIGTDNFKVNRAFNSDEEIYAMAWTKEKECFLFSRAIGSFKRQSLYKYCLGNDAATIEITDGGYLVGILNKN